MNIKQNKDVNYGQEIYHTIYYKGELIIKGTRENTLERMVFVDVQDKVVVDIGCNIGASCILALEKGAKKVYGFDNRQENIDRAKWVADRLGLDINYQVRDYGQDQIKMGDIAFCFSVDAYIDHTVLANNLAKYNTVYFETHLNHKLPDIIRKKFKKVEKLSELVEKDGLRKLYRLRGKI